MKSHPTGTGIQPHRMERYMASNDPLFEEKAADVLGPYLHPPQHALVLCVDEKTAIQALDRKEPILPLSPGRAERHGFEYVRHGTLSLYAALNTKTGEGYGKTAARHTSQEIASAASASSITRRTPAVARLAGTRSSPAVVPPASVAPVAAATLSILMLFSTHQVLQSSAPPGAVPGNLAPSRRNFQRELTNPVGQLTRNACVAAMLDGAASAAAARDLTTLYELRDRRPPA